jgi:hypothetical protein
MIRALRTPAVIILLVFGILQSARPQDSLPPFDGYQRGKISTFRRDFGLGMVGLLSAGILADSYFTWWKDVEKPFSFYREGWFDDAHLGIDKAGHFFGSHTTFKLTREFLLYAGVSPNAALWWGAGIAMFHSFEIEIGDGFSPYGFSLEDLTMGTLGISYGILQTEVPFMRNFNFKFSSWSNAIKSPANFTSDYDAMTIWLTADVHELLPSTLDSYWPKFLQIAVGYGVGWERTRREFVFGLDFNLEAFAPCSDEMLITQRVLDTMHFPAPSVKLTTGKGPLYYLAHIK